MALKKCRQCGKPVSTEAMSCPKCGQPMPTEGWKEREARTRKTWLIAGLSVMAFLMLRGFFTSVTAPSGPPPPGTVSLGPGNTSVAVPAAPPPSASTYVAELEREIAGMGEFTPPTSKEGIVARAAVFSHWATLAARASNYTLTEEEQATVDRFRAEASAVQRRQLPQMRDALGPALHQDFWREDMEVRTFGSGFRTIRFTGGAFAANRNIEEFQTTVLPTLRMLRFRRAEYEWYRDARDLQYYTLTPPDDGELVSL